MVRKSGILVLAALAATATAAAAGVPIKAFARPHHPYDNLPAAARTFAPGVANSRRVATAIDAKKNQYLVYVTLMKDKRVCTVLIQGKSYSARCTPQAILFVTGRQSFSVSKGLIGGVVANDVTRIALVGGSKRKVVQLTSDNGFIFGCPAPSTCASWVKTVVGYNAAGKIVSRESVG